MLGTIDSLGIQKDTLGPVAQMRRCGGAVVDVVDVDYAVDMCKFWGLSSWLPRWCSFSEKVCFHFISGFPNWTSRAYSDNLSYQQQTTELLLIMILSTIVFGGW